MTDTIHHTIRNRTSAKLLLCRQWVERINYEAKELGDDYRFAHGRADTVGIERTLNELLIWERRLIEDMDTQRTRLTQDGYTSIGQVTARTNVGLQPFELDVNGDYAFLPMLQINENGGIDSGMNAVDVWERKAVQS